MKLAIGMVELNSIARGIEVCDFMVKAAHVTVLRSSTVCPGKYMVIVGGETADVSASMAEGEKRAGEYLVDRLLISNVHPQLMPAISMTSEVEEYGALGVLEFFSVSSAIIAADAAAKAANITLIDVCIGYAIGGKGYVTLTGDVGAVRAAVAAAEKNTELLLTSAIIPKPSPELYSHLL